MTTATGSSIPWPLWIEQAYASWSFGASSSGSATVTPSALDQELLVLAVVEQPQHRAVHQPQVVQVAAGQHQLVADPQPAAEHRAARADSERRRRRAFSASIPSAPR